ncbi:MAG: DUF559 domain-containing protein [Solirubrobacterales bacterium]
MAAVLACGDEAALSHRSAAALWNLRSQSGPAVGVGGPIDVVVPFERRPSPRRGIRVHRSRSMPPGTIVRPGGIPVTNPARTIADMRRASAPSEIRSMVRKAEVLGLRTELAPRREPTRSELEDLFLGFCGRFGFPRPLVNRDIAGLEVDFSWPDPRVAVETDSYRFHRGAQAYENDHERDLDLRAAGYDVVRLTWRQMTHKPDRCATAVAAALNERR